MRSKVATPKSIKLAKQWFADNPGQKLNVAYGEYWTEARFYQWLRGVINARCNRGLKFEGRKHSPDWFRLMLHTSRELNSNHVIHWLPFELREKFGHRLFSE